jgi:hypothetical protein
VTRKAFEQRGKTFHFALLGGVCGLGLLTKATMLPFVAALGLFLTWRTWCARGDAAAVRALVLIALLSTYSPAWYLHSLAPLLAPLVARGLAEAAARRRARLFISALVIYPVLFLPFATALVLFYFAGCFNEPSDVAHFGLTIVATCAAFPHEVLSHLTVLGNPALAFPLVGAGWAAMLIGVVLVIKGQFFAAGTALFRPKTDTRTG